MKAMNELSSSGGGDMASNNDERGEFAGARVAGAMREGSLTAAAVKAAAREFGADLVGIASVEALGYLPPKHNPLSIHSRARSVIVLARKVLRGSLRGVEEGTDKSNSYPYFGLYGLDDNFLAKTTYDLTIWIETFGFEAVPLFAYEVDGQPAGVPVAPGKPAPNVILPYRIMAQAAGLGEVGLNGLVLTPQFGPRQRFSMLVSDAALECDEPFEPRICNDCGACAEACPLHALDIASASLFGMPGFERKVAERNDARCRKCVYGAVQTNEGRFEYVDRMAAVCNRDCIAELERRGVLLESFGTPFRG